MIPPESGNPESRPGSSTFTIEGRRAPALWVVGWIGLILGLGAVVVSTLSGGTTASTILLVTGLIVLSVGLVALAGSQGIERRARARSSYLGPSPFLVFAAAIPVSLLVALLVGIPLSLVGVALDGPLAALASVIAQALVYVALLRLLVVDVGALTWVEMGIRRFDAYAVRDLLVGAAWALPVIAVTGVVAVILTSILPGEPVSPLPPAGETAGFALNLLAGAVVAPLSEELMFRGFATTAWARDLGPTKALVRGAVFFAAVHVLTVTAGTAGEAVGLILLGFAARVPVALALGWLFLQRRSLWVSIGLHAAFNGVLLTLAEIGLRSGAL